MRRQWIAIIMLLAVLLNVAHSMETKEKVQLKKVIQKLYSHLQSEQVQEDQPFRKYPPQFSKQKGLYSSDIKLNLISKDNSFFTHLFRETFNVFDSNMFVTNFVVLGLLEAADLGQIHLNQSSLDEAIDSLLTFKDKNQKNSTTPVYNFWSQINVNGTWQSYPSNLEGIMDIFDSLPPFLQKLVKIIGIDPKELSQMVSSFVIPPDNDDSGINIALGSVLRANKEKYPQLYAKWEQQNNDYHGFYEIVKKYAYRPLNQQHPQSSSTNASDIIDPRTYYYLHDFIQQNSEYPISLFSTWLINQNDEKAHIVKQPFHTNNVDMTVNANSLFGLNSLLTTLPLEEAQSLFQNDQELKTLHRNVTNLLAYGIHSGIVLSRTDLALTYYPSEFDFYWFVARNVHLLRTAKARGQLHFEELEYSLNTLEDALLNVGISQLLNISQNDENGNIFWEGFLGNFANKTFHEDRLFSTAVTLNTLIDAFTVTSHDNKTRQYIDNTHDCIKETIKKVANFIISAQAKLSTPYMNSFFSGSVKGFTSLPFFYPSNYGLYINNGTTIDPSKASMSSINDDLVIAFKGSVSKEEYNKLLNQTWFTMPTPTTFQGFNEPGDGFPFWSSKSVTYVFMIQALSKYSSLV